MTLKLIGSGFGRTGTMSTKLALEKLGFGPTHHMIEVIENPAQQPHWDAYARGDKMDWARVFTGYNSQVDFPGAAVWEQLIAAFPAAKVIHTERPEEEWWASFSTTIGKFFDKRTELALPPPIAALFSTMDRILVDGVFGGLDKATAISAYRRNNAKVRATIPAERLLVFSPVDGWEPLCRFVGAAVPDEPFPRSNARDEFWAHFGGEPPDPAR
jgi:hypothetical protein